MKAIAIDIDGTITDEKRHLSLKAVKELRKAKSSDIKLVLCTGNIACFARSAAILIGTDEPVIAENGGVIEIKDKKEIVLGDKSEVKEAYSFLKQKISVERYFEDRKTEIVLKNDLDVSKVKEIVSSFDVQVIDTGFAVHLTPINVSKGKALKKVSDILNMDLSDFLAIGDSLNDISLLKTAEIGVAVENSPIELKNSADLVLDEKNGDGVVVALRKFLDYEK